MSEVSADVKLAGWDGATSPLRASYGKLFMWFFLISDALTFSGFLSAYGFFRHRYSGEWPVPSTVFHHFRRASSTLVVCGFDDLYSHYELRNYGTRC